ncbi:uncharacterized protein V6R79_010102 [Siganus canaliculatus]
MCRGFARFGHGEASATLAAHAVLTLRELLTSDASAICRRRLPLPLPRPRTAVREKAAGPSMWFAFVASNTSTLELMRRFWRVAERRQDQTPQPGVVVQSTARSGSKSISCNQKLRFNGGKKHDYRQLQRKRAKKVKRYTAEQQRDLSAQLHSCANCGKSEESKQRGEEGELCSTWRLQCDFSVTPLSLCMRRRRRRRRRRRKAFAWREQNEVVFVLILEVDDGEAEKVFMDEESSVAIVDL